MAGDNGQLEKLHIPTLDEEKSAFSISVIGQQDAVENFARVLVNLRSGLKPDKPGPLDVLFLAGPSGVGKTEITLALAKLLSDGEVGADQKVMVINGGEYQEAHYTARLFGSPPGYVGSKGSGSEIPPVLSQRNLESHQIKFKDRNGQTKGVTIILVDEAEKANDAVHKAFLSILDKGRLQMADSSETDFSNTVIVFTSNIGNQTVERLLKGKDPKAISQDEKRGIIVEAIGNKYPPELRGRMRKFVIFNNLTEEAIHKIAIKQVGEVEKMFRTNQINIDLELSPEALDFLSKTGYSTSEGARAMGKVITEHVREPLILIHGDIGIAGKKIYIDLDEEGKLGFYFNGEEQTVNLPEGKPEEGFGEAQVPKISEKPETLEVSKREEVDGGIIDRDILGGLIEPLVRYDISGRETSNDIRYAIQNYRRRLDELTSAGLVDRVAAHNAVKNDPVIKEWALRTATESFQTVHFANVKDSLSLNGFLTQEEIVNYPPIVEKAKIWLEKALASGVGTFNEVRKLVVREGIGNTEYWNSAFQDALIDIAKGKK